MATLAYMEGCTKKKIAKELGLIVGISVVMSYVMGLSYPQNLQAYLFRFLVTFSIWLVMWYGNAYVSHLADKRISWLTDPGQRFIVGVIGAASYSVLALLALKWFYSRYFDIQIMGDSVVIWVYTAVFSVLVLIAMLFKEFLYAWRELALREEKMKNDVLTSNFESLKNQVNPHFMFNSLNTLTSLIYQNQDLAANYVGQLSNVYRSVLSAGKNELITLAEELHVLDSYLFLQNIRFEDRFHVQLDISEEAKQKYVPPMVLQMLIENSLKHNEITVENPLLIKVYQKENMLCIENSKAPKQVLPGDKSAIGLHNIKERYALLSDIPVVVKDEEKNFCVQIPLLTLT